MAYGDEGAPGTWRNFLYFYLPDLYRRYWGVRFSGGWLGTLFDSISSAIMDAALSPYLKGNSTPAYDALRLLGNETSMPQYATEGWVQYRSRLETDWETWTEQAGTFRGIVNQLALAGAPGSQVFRFSESGSWSDFVVFYPAGSHTVTGSLEIGSGWLIGDGSIVGPLGVTPEQLSTYRDLITHWKPAIWRCPWIIFEINGWTIGTGHTVGEVGLVIGGEQVRTSVQR